MEIVDKIFMDFKKPRINIIHAKQGDFLTRKVNAFLYDGQEKFKIPEGSSFIVRYFKADNTFGFYDKLPNGQEAVEVNTESDIIINLAPQALSCEGKVTCSVSIIISETTLQTFSFVILVEKTEGFSGKSDDYINYPRLNYLISSIGDLENLNTDDKSSLVNAINEIFNGNHYSTDETLSQSGIAADSKVVGLKFNELKNGKGSVNVSGATAKTFFISSELNGVYFMCETGKTDEPSVAFYGENGDEPVLLQNVAEPKAASDASNKDYVDKTFSKAPRVFRQVEEPEGANDGDFWIDPEEEDEVDDDDFVTVEEMKDYVSKAISSALDEIGFAEGVEY